MEHITFKKFLEQNKISQIETDPLYSLKNNVSEKINEFLIWAENESEESSIDDVKSNVLNLGRHLEGVHKELFSAINNLVVREVYQENYNKVIAKINMMKNPPKDIDEYLKELINELNIFQNFVQSKIAIS